MKSLIRDRTATKAEVVAVAAVEVVNKYDLRQKQEDDMYRICLLFALTMMVTASGRVGGERSEGVTVMFWNLENFFDFIDGGAGESDAEFSSTGPRRWTKKRFYRKCQAVAKTILWTGSLDGGKDEPLAVRKVDGSGARTGQTKGDVSVEGKLVMRETEESPSKAGRTKGDAQGDWQLGNDGPVLPDVVGMAEVENLFVLRQLVSRTALRKMDYKIVHFDSPDPRGIDCALLYRASRLTLVSAGPCSVSAPGLQTRDILLAQFLTQEGDSLAVLVNHHPSKYGGGETDWRREVAVARLRALGDSLAAAGWLRSVAVGDFNDTPENPLFERLSPAFSLCSMVTPENRRQTTADIGSIRFNGEWQLIDLCFVSPALARSASFSVLEPPFLTERDAAHSGDRPLRTYSGPRYRGGVSDHRPILVRVPTPSRSPDR